MSSVTTPSVVRQLGSLFEGGSVAGLSDRQLLERFIARRDAAGEAAFAALVARHGPMVLGVCRQLLGDRHHAEDAFQAVFLVLARKARSIRDPDLLGNWLYGVALRTARKARGRLARRRRSEEDGAVRRPEAGLDRRRPIGRSIDREQAEALHGEIDRLPRCLPPAGRALLLRGPHRSTRRRGGSAARPGRVRSRLARAREKLRRGLTRRGVVLPAAALAAVLAPRSASASVSSPLCDTTTRAAIALRGRTGRRRGASASATALAQEVLRSMLLHKLKLTAMTLLFLAAVATGAGWLDPLAGDEGRTREDPAARRQASRRDARSARPATTPDPAAPGRMTVAGRVLDPDGKPVEGAAVDVDRAAPHALGRRERRDATSTPCSARAQTDGDGRFRLDAPRTASTRVLRGLRPGRRARVRPRLGRAEPRRRAARGRDPAPARAGHPRPAGRRERPAGRGRRGPRPERRRARTTRAPFDGVSLWDEPARGASAPGRGRSRPTTRGGSRSPASAAASASASASATSASPGRICIVDADRRGGRQGDHPGARAGPDHRGPRPGRRHRPADPERRRLGHRPGPERARPAGIFTAKFRADDQGRFTIEPHRRASYYRVSAFPPGGQPYLVPQDEFAVDQGGGQEVSRDIKLPRGVLIRGKVTEAGDRPPAGRRRASSSSPCRGGDERALGLAGDRGQQGRRLVPDRRPARQGTPARLRPDRRLRPRGDRLQPALRRSARRDALLRPRHHPLRGQGRRPAARGRRGAAAGRDDQGPRRRARRADGRPTPSILTTLHIEPFNLVLARRLPDPRSATAASSCTGSIPEATTRDLLPRRRARVGRDGRGLRQAGRRGPDDPARSPAARPRRGSSGPTASPSPSTGPYFEFVATPGPSRVQPERAGPGRAGGRRGLPRQRRSQALLERPAHRRRGPHHPARPDPRRAVPDHRLLDASTTRTRGSRSARTSPSSPARRSTWAIS